MSSRLLVSYGASPAVVRLIIDFVEQDGFGLVTGITSLSESSIDQNFHNGDEQRTVSSSLSFRIFVGSYAIQGIVNTSMLPASMVEEADLVRIWYDTVVSSVSYPLFASSRLQLWLLSRSMTTSTSSLPVYNSTHLPALKISCMVLDLTKHIDTNVQGKVNKSKAFLQSYNGLLTTC